MYVDFVPGYIGVTFIHVHVSRPSKLFLDILVYI